MSKAEILAARDAIKRHGFPAVLPRERKRRSPRHWCLDYIAETRATYVAGVGLVRRLTVRRRSGKDGISWDVLQRIKNDVLGDDAWVIEVYPSTSSLVDEINMRHLWEVPEGHPARQFTLDR